MGIRIDVWSFVKDFYFEILDSFRKMDFRVERVVVVKFLVYLLFWFCF